MCKMFLPRGRKIVNSVKDRQYNDVFIIAEFEM